MKQKQLSDILTPEETEFLEKNPHLLQLLKTTLELQKQCDYWRNAYRKMRYTYEMNVDPFKKTNIPKP